MVASAQLRGQPETAILNLCGIQDRQVISAVELAVDNAVEQYLPVGLRLELDIQALVLEVSLLVADRQRRHVGELDEAELQVFFLRLAVGSAA